ncbi:hypothetical protein GCM10023082_24730 [Streptomyces tremellae]|uniref:Uncharacterized protein n=1 Tax=Streptomyces tremellae TaxID=1124239 RepID=A0ABP7EVI7_9ACTN
MLRHTWAWFMPEARKSVVASARRPGCSGTPALGHPPVTMLTPCRRLAATGSKGCAAADRMPGEWGRTACLPRLLLE